MNNQGKIRCFDILWYRIFTLCYEELFDISDCCGMSKMRATFASSNTDDQRSPLPTFYCHLFSSIPYSNSSKKFLLKWATLQVSNAITRRLRNLQVFAHVATTLTPFALFHDIPLAYSCWNELWKPHTLLLLFICSLDILTP